MQASHHIILTVDIYIAEHAERAQVINACHMVVVDMADNHSINLCERESCGLLTEVWSAVNEHTNASVSLKIC